ncbi:MAG: hypothetical protein IBJ03_10215 [Gemmatimonadaceae bacterium]|nr:hypothetical protein [Gemmatimonadaceae bacterium]
MSSARPIPRDIADNVSVVRLRQIAIQLGPLTDRIVFIGGAIAPLLQSEPVLPRVRPTKDVDAIIAMTSYAELGPLRESLRARGFVEDQRALDHFRPLHLHRWISPTGEILDLVPAGSHTGGTGSVQDAYAIESAVFTDLKQSDTASPYVVQHASAPAFLALKWAAFEDRGRSAPFDSHDLEDIIALVASRSTLRSECLESPGTIQQFIADHFLTLLDDSELTEELVVANLPLDAETSLPVRRRTLQRMTQLAAIGRTPS